MDDIGLAGAAGVDGSAAADATPEPAGVPEIDQYELDDIPLAHLPMPGPTMLALTFRVGRADEPVVRGGMTHLAEHLVMTAVAKGVDHSLEHANGTTEPFNVSFLVRGTPAEASSFLRDVCRAIERPPIARMHEEAKVLRTEGAMRAGSRSMSFQSIWYRTGFQGIGTINMPEMFLWSMDEAVLRAWMAEHLVAGNAAIWVAGELRDDLLVSLPPGPRAPMPAYREIPGLETPTIAGEELPGFAISFLVDRSAASMTAMRTLDRWLRRALRVDRGLGYDVSSDLLPVGADLALATVWATCLPDATAEVERVIFETVDDLAARGPSEPELHELYARSVRDAADPMAVPSRLSAHVRDQLMGRPATVMTALLEEQWRLEPAQVAAAFKRARDSMLVLVPNGTRRPQRPFRPYPGPDRDPMGSGRSFAYLGMAKGRLPWQKAKAPTLTIGERGAAMDDAAGRRLIAVAWAGAVAVLRRGRARTLIGADGISLTIDPTDWRDGPAAIALVDRHAPAHLVVTTGD